MAGGSTGLYDLKAFKRNPCGRALLIGANTPPSIIEP